MFRPLFCSILILLMTSCNETEKASWRSLPLAEPAGILEENIKCYLSDPHTTEWDAPAFYYDNDVAVKPKVSKVIVVIYNPVLENRGGVKLINYLKANDPVEYSKLLCKTISAASGRYINYEIADFIELDEYPVKTDGFTYDDSTFTEVARTQEWHHPDRSNYREIFDKNGLTERCIDENISEIWLWGAGGFGFDELAMYIPNRYARFAPTDNPWFYRPYEIPEEIGHTMWVMGFNYQVGTGNMVHSYSHRCESMMALVIGSGKWETELAGQDPWNTFTIIGSDHPGYPSQIGNVHVPPNGQFGYDYLNDTLTYTCANSWINYPDLSEAEQRLINHQEWGETQYDYQLWWLNHLPKLPGYTRWGYNNWWVYIANTDEELPDWQPAGPEEFKINKNLVPLKTSE